MPEQDQKVELGLTLLGRASNPEAVAAAAGMLGESLDPRIRQVITEKYRQLASGPRRRDTGCFQRTALVRAIRGRATPQDVPLLETALWTREFVGADEVGAELRAAALVTLDGVDGELASFHAVRLLTDAHPMSGEPGATSVRLLAAHEQFLPLYGLVTGGNGSPEVRAEGLRALTGLPPSLLLRLLDDYRKEKDEAVLIGLFDLLLTHPSRASFGEFIGSLLDTTQSVDLYRFLVTSIVASREPSLVALLKRPDGPDEASPKGKVLREALS